MFFNPLYLLNNLLTNLNHHNPIFWYTINYCKINLVLSDYNIGALRYTPKIPNITFPNNIRPTTIIPKVYYPDKSLSRRFIIPTSHYPENFFNDFCSLIPKYYVLIYYNIYLIFFYCCIFYYICYLNKFAKVNATITMKWTF